MAIDKLTPRYLNKDEDPRIVKSVELIDALNIRVSNDEDGNAGVLKNIKGNTVVAYKNTSDTLPAGDNKVLGNVTNLQKDEVFYFVYNSNSDHSIYKYSVSSDKVIKVYQDSVLEFTENGFVKADIIVNQYNDTLLCLQTVSLLQRRSTSLKLNVVDIQQNTAREQILLQP